MQKTFFYAQLYYMIVEKKYLGRTSLFYLILTAVSAWMFFLINQHGKALFPREVLSSISKTHDTQQLLHVLIALVSIILVTRLGGFLLRKVGQPPVIGEIIGGIMLGPSLLGKISPETMNYLLPASVTPLINIIAQIGIILFMFLVGLEIDLNALKKSAHSTIAISHASIIFPFILGAALALWIFESLAPVNVDFTSFSLFLGVSMSITAFPVLARILTDQKLNKTSLGSLALTCAAIDDVTAWCLLAFVTSYAESKVSNAFGTLALTVIYISLMLILVKPYIEKVFARLDQAQAKSENVMTLILIAALVSSTLTEFIGIHAIFGAFLIGAIIPHDNKASEMLNYRLQDIVRILFLPAFFAFTGMRTQIGLVNSTQDWIFCAVIIVVAIIGKLGGTLFAARLSGLGWKNSVALGILMNTRGLVELIVLNIGLDLGVISPRLFTMMVIMALVTTLITGPALKLLKGFDGISH